MGGLQSKANARLAGLYRYRIPLSRPLRLAGREYGERSGLLLRLRQRGADGAWREGVGEVAPLPGFSPETLAQCQQALIAAAHDWQQGDSTPTAQLPLPPSAAFGWDCALAELQQGPLLWPASSASDPYPLLDGEPAALLHRWQQWPAPRPALIKLKLARRDSASASEAALIHALLQHTPQLRLRLDANRAWSLAEASDFCAALTPAERQQIDYLEEPCRDFAESRQLAERYALPLALDESLRAPDAPTPAQLAAAPQLAALVLKPAISGGLDWLRPWLALGQRRQLRCVISSSFQSSLGCGQLAALAAQLTPSEAPGLDTLGSFEADLLRPAPASSRPLLGWEQLACVWISADPTGTVKEPHD